MASDSDRDTKRTVGTILSRNLVEKQFMGKQSFRAFTCLWDQGMGFKHELALQLEGGIERFLPAAWVLADIHASALLSPITPIRELERPNRWSLAGR